MRFMMLMIPNLDPKKDYMPSADAVAAMTRYNEELKKAGALLALDGLHPPTKAVRVRFGEKKSARPTSGPPERATAVDGPFAEAKEMVGGYWMIQVRSKAEAVEWAKRCPAADGDTIEIRQVFELADFPPDVRAAATSSR